MTKRIFLFFCVTFLFQPISYAQEYWCATWWSTDGWQNYPYGSHMHSAGEAIETSQLNRDRGFGVGQYSCTTSKYLALVNEGYFFNTTYGCEVGYSPTDEVHEVVCTNSGGSENNYRYVVVNRESHYLSASIPPNKTCEGNPCNPATGNKFQTEVDYEASGASDLKITDYNGFC